MQDIKSYYTFTKIEPVLQLLTETEQYLFGKKSGEILKLIH